MNELLFGAAYYDEYMPYDRLQQDMEMMKAAGMNVIRIAESTWSVLEPQEGQYDFYHIDRVLKAAEQAGLKVIIGTPTYAVPHWLVKKDPAVLARTKAGQERYGRRQNMDITNPTYRAYAERIIRVLLAHTAHHAHVIGFQIDNETKHYGTAGERVQELFVQHLQQEFGSTEAMNRAFGLAHWSNTIAAWGDMPDVTGTINGSLACEFEKFRRRLATEFLAWQAAIVDEYRREDQFVTQNLDFEWISFGAPGTQDGFSYGVQSGADHYAISRSLTMAGTDIYHYTQDKLTGAEIAFGGDEIRSLKRSSYLVLETQAQAFKEWLPYKGQLRLHAYSHLASGAGGVMYWNWHSLHNGYETYWKGILSHDLESNPTYEECARIGAELKVHGDRLAGFTKQNKVALLVSNESLSALDWFPIDKELSYNDVVRWMYDSLYELNIECDIVFPDCTWLEDYEVLILPALYSGTEALLRRLDRFVRDGGTLLATFKTGFTDEYVKVWHDRQPHGLTECFGISYNQFTKPEQVQVMGRPAAYWMELLRPQGAEVLAHYEHPEWQQYAAITKNHYGRGCAYYIGCYVDKQVLKELLCGILGDRCSSKVFAGAQWPVIVRIGISQQGERLHYILHYSREQRKISCGLNRAYDILSGESYQAGDEITLDAWGVRILAEQEDSD